VEYLKREGFDLQFGARPLKRLMQRKILDGLSLAMLENRITPGMNIEIDANENGVVFRPVKNGSAVSADQENPA
jgi:ATP-dependent Clp protease ATP-binding subunit ClpB